MKAIRSSRIGGQCNERAEIILKSLDKGEQAGE